MNTPSSTKPSSTVTSHLTYSPLHSTHPTTSHQQTESQTPCYNSPYPTRPPLNLLSSHNKPKMSSPYKSHIRSTSPPSSYPSRKRIGSDEPSHESLIELSPSPSNSTMADRFPSLDDFGAGKPSQPHPYHLPHLSIFQVLADTITLFQDRLPPATPPPTQTAISSPASVPPWGTTRRSFLERATTLLRWKMAAKRIS